MATDLKFRFPEDSWFWVIPFWQRALNLNAISRRLQEYAPAVIEADAHNEPIQSEDGIFTVRVFDDAAVEWVKTMLWADLKLEPLSESKVIPTEQEP